MQEEKEKVITSKIETAVRLEQNTIPYVPMTNLPSLGTVVPLALASETITAQYKFKEEIPDVIHYLTTNLKYRSKLALSDALMSEQADAVAFAIYQIERQKGLILSDMAGIGKGRVNAAILRYAFVNGFLPVFITYNGSLFSAMYRDIVDIGGLDEKNGKPYYGNPFIINGYTSGGTEIVRDENGNTKKIQKPSATSIVDRNGTEIIVPLDKSEIKGIVKGDTIPKGFDYVLMTYSQISSKDNSDKLEYLLRVFEKLNKKVIICMDEVHKAAGESITGYHITKLLASTEGCMFSSATFSKRPENMFLYAPKTDISTAPVSADELIDGIKVGGERLTEYLASNLVRSLQMLRRERTYENCNVEYDYMKQDDELSIFKKYDNTIKLYNEIKDFFDDRLNPLYREAKIKVIQRYADENKIKLAEPRENGELEKLWRIDNRGKYRVNKFTIGDIIRSRFNFIETLLFAIKSDYVSNIAIQQLKNLDLPNKLVDGNVPFLSNRKPVISVRNTLEGVLKRLGLKKGDIIDKADFSMYIISLLKEATTGTIGFREVLLMGEEDREKKITLEEVVLLPSDYPDNGDAYNKLMNKIENIDLQLPLSPLDDLIDKIEATPREFGDDKYNDSENYTVGEVTSRNLRLKKLKNGKFQIISNPRDKNSSTAFKKFNSGIYDVLIINEKGSTGEDAHSSKNFIDQRPRVMIIHQVELDVAIEVQKRGRVNRTGMVNYPTYIYAVSVIPSEIRRLVMLARKLKSLDANVTGNQKQSAKLSAIQDANGNEIQDIANEYGDELLLEFLKEEDNKDYQIYLPTDEQGKISKLNDDSIITTFMRNLELALSEMQLGFYNTINSQYIDYVEKLKAKDEYNLETIIKDLKGQIINRLVVFQGQNTSAFNQSVYIEDVMANVLDKPLSKEEVVDLANELANGKDIDTNYDDFINDLLKYRDEEYIPYKISHVKVPDYDKYPTDVEKLKAKLDYEANVEDAKKDAISLYNGIYKLLTSYRPMRKCAIPDDFEEVYNLTGKDVPSKYNYGRFVGLKLLKGGNNKYAPNNIVFVFCQLSGTAKVEIKPNSKGLQIFQYIIGADKLNIVEIQKIDAWVIDKSKRKLIRVLTGDMISAFALAQKLTTENIQYTKSIKFLKFTTIEESSIRLGINLTVFGRYFPLNPTSQKVIYNLNNANFIDALYLQQNNLTEIYNDKQNFFISIDYRKLYVYILKGKGKGKKKDFLSPLSTDGTLMDMIQNRFTLEDTIKVFIPVGKERNVTVPCKKFTVDKSDPTSKGKLLEIFDYYVNHDNFFVSIYTKQDKDIIIDAPVQQIDTDLEGDESDKKEYEYALLTPFNTVEVRLKGFAKFNKVDLTKGKYGVVYLFSRANPLECTSYSLMPLTVPPIKLVKDSLGLLADTDKLNYTLYLKKLIDSGVSDREIFDFIEKTFDGKVLKLENVFGLYAKDFEKLVKLHKDFFDGKLEDADVELPKLDEIDLDEEAKLVISYDTIQDFIILLKAKTR